MFVHCNTNNGKLSLKRNAVIMKRTSWVPPNDYCMDYVSGLSQVPVLMILELNWVTRVKASIWFGYLVCDEGKTKTTHSDNEYKLNFHRTLNNKSQRKYTKMESIKHAQMFSFTFHHSRLDERCVFSFNLLHFPHINKSIYELGFNHLAQYCNQLELDLASPKIRIDSEIANHQAARSVWPIAKVQGCRFHLSQSVLNSCQSPIILLSI